MDIEESYKRIFWFFDRWVRVMEFHTRIMEIQDSFISSHKILILSPPTDTGIKILTQINFNGETHLMCFSERLAEIAKEYSIENGIENLNIFIDRFFNLPFKDGYFDAVFANCFFDFCQNSDIDKIICEIKRVLKKGGGFYSVYMNLPSMFCDHLWTILIKLTPYLRNTIFPVDIKDLLVQHGFKVEKDIMARRLGFPIKYIVALK
jgi:ubiquinone/menaquinone biosynthesis C-methylase UbiE